MQVIIPSKGRSSTISTHLIFQDCPDAQVTVLVHNTDEYATYLNNMPRPSSECFLMETGVKADAYGLTRQREWAINNLVEPGEWFVFADDNIRHLQAIQEPFYSELELPVPWGKSVEWRAAFRADCSGNRFIQEIVPDMIEVAESIGANLCGFSLTDNPFFRRNHWVTVGYVIGKLMVLRNTRIPYRHNITMEDFTFTAEHLLRYSKVLINNYVRPHAYHYEDGGMGTIDKRLRYRYNDCKKLMKLFPGLFRYKKSDFMNMTDLAINIHTEERIKKWRQTMRKPLRASKKTPIR